MLAEFPDPKQRAAVCNRQYEKAEDGRLVKNYQTSLKVAEGERAFVARITTTSVDRDGDVVLPSGVKLEDYERNPTVLWAHDSGATPVARTQAIERTQTGIRAKARFHQRPPSLPKEQEWLPDTLLDLFRDGAALGFSIGFVPTSWRQASDMDMKNFGDEARRVIDKWTLLEFSIVPIPCNQDCLLEAVSKGVIRHDSQLCRSWHLYDTLMDKGFTEGLRGLTIETDTRPRSLRRLVVETE